MDFSNFMRQLLLIIDYKTWILGSKAFCLAILFNFKNRFKNLEVKDTASTCLLIRDLIAL